MFSIVQKKVSSKKAPPSIKHGALKEKKRGQNFLAFFFFFSKFCLNVCSYIYEGGAYN